MLPCRWLFVAVHEPWYSSTEPSSKDLTGVFTTGEDILNAFDNNTSPRTGEAVAQSCAAADSINQVCACCLHLIAHSGNFRSVPSGGLLPLTSISCWHSGRHIRSMLTLEAALWLMLLPHVQAT